MVSDMTERVPARLNATLERARDGAYLSVGQFAEELRGVEAGAKRRRRELAIAVAVLVTLLLAAILLTLR
jgi:hypothetical protein